MSRFEDESSKQVSGVYVEDVEKDGLSRVPTGQSELELDTKGLARLYRKVDFVLLPILCLLYACALLDRVNISAARVDGMGKDLNLLSKTSNAYSVALLVFFPAYALAEIPSNVFLRRIGTRRWLSFVCFAFGIVSIGAGFVKSWKTLAVCRVFLGLAEGSFFPGAVYLLTCWYRREQLALRLSVFYMTGSMLSGFSGLIAAGISDLEGKGGLRGWRWIFICEGLATVILAVVAFFIISDFPQDAAWLGDSDRRAIIQGLERDRHDAKHDHKHITTRETLGYLSEWKAWYYGVCFGCSTVSTYALAYFAPVIIQSLGYTGRQALVLSSPPYLVGVVYAIILAAWSDRIKLRSPFIVFNCVMVIIGLSLVAYVKNPHTRYGGVFLAVFGSALNVPMTISFASSATVDNGRRGVYVAVQTMWGAVGGAVASVAYRQAQAPKYGDGITTTLTLTALLAVLTSAQALYYRNRNARADAGEIVIYGVPGFRYMY